jgi:hypothetical protein
MKLHPRHRLVSKARQDLRKKVLEWFNETPELTTAEELEIISEVLLGLIQGTAKMIVKEERKEDV